MKTAARHRQLHSHSQAEGSSAGAEARAYSGQIIARFQPQEIAAGKIVDAGAHLNVDVTAAVLSLTARQVHALSDNCQSTDDLVPYGMHMHNSVSRVEVCDAICRYFGVKELRDIDERRMGAARAEHSQWRRGVHAAAAVCAVTRRASDSFDLSRLHPSPGARSAFHL